jgi:signal transduction histidine kinase
LKHARACQINVRLHFGETNVCLEISDDGLGFGEKEFQPNPEGHFGLSGMKERVRHLGGTFQVRSEPGKGTMVQATVPLNGGRSVAEKALPDLAC